MESAITDNLAGCQTTGNLGSSLEHRHGVSLDVIHTSVDVDRCLLASAVVQIGQAPLGQRLQPPIGVDLLVNLLVRHPHGREHCP